jgi:two-component system chemotaxis response regulator CheY
MSLATMLEVMVVDDTSVSRALITDALDQIGIAKVTIAKDGAQALALLKAKPVHLVISDMNMPGLDGIGLLKAIREHGPTSKIGFIMVTGSSDKTILTRAQQYKLNNYVAKPFTTVAMKRAIEAVFGKLS